MRLFGRLRGALFPSGSTLVATFDSRLRVRATYGSDGGGKELRIQVANVGPADVVVDIRPELVVRIDAFAGMLPSRRRVNKAIPVQLRGEPLPCRLPAGDVLTWAGSLERVEHRLGRELRASDSAYIVVRPAGGKPQAVMMRSR